MKRPTVHQCSPYHAPAASRAAAATPKSSLRLINRARAGFVVCSASISEVFRAIASSAGNGLLLAGASEITFSRFGLSLRSAAAPIESLSDPECRTRVLTELFGHYLHSLNPSVNMTERFGH